MFLNPELINELMLKDNDVTCRSFDIELPIGLGFGLRNGAIALHERGIYGKFFHYQQYADLTPKMVKILDTYLGDFSKGFDSMAEEFPKDFKYAALN